MRYDVFWRGMVGCMRGLILCAALGTPFLCWEAATGQPTTAVLPFQNRIEDVARSLRNSPRLKSLTDQQRIDRVEFVVGNTLFVLLHELGHVLITEMKLPVLGRIEDTADTFATLRLLTIGTGFSQRVLGEASKGWFLNDRRDQQTGEKPLYFDEHNLNQQRAYQIVCLMVGSDPAKFKGLADETKMPKSRQETCKEDYARAAWSWDAVLKPHRRASDQPETGINVIYRDAEGRVEGFARSFQAVRILEAVAQRSAAEFAWPHPFTLEMKSCGRAEAAWDDKSRALRICYELAYDFAELYRAYVFESPVQTGADPRRKRTKK
jgi:hypothetical protein